VKNWQEFYSEYEAWNAFSRVTVFPSKLHAAQHVQIKDGLRPTEEDHSPETKLIDIDGSAWTPMMNFTGDVSALQFLRASVMYVAHYLKPAGSVLIIGTGGGRDILAAHAFGQPSVLGIELNPLIRRAVQEQYGDYSGRPYTLPGVDVIVDEARSRLSTLDRTFDIIQISLIDTFSLNATGGFVYSENYLYTRQAFQEYFRHLSPDGILTVSRYFVPQYPLEILKLAGLARAAWAAEGVDQPSDHIVVLGQGIHVSVLAKRSPFTAAELDTLSAVAKANGMTMLFAPGEASDDTMGLKTLLTTPAFQEYVDAYPYQIAPPTDDRPFFFNFLRGRLAAADIPDQKNDPFLFMQLWNEAIWVMYLLVAVVTTLALVFFFGPLVFLARRRSAAPPRVAMPLLLYFACLGYGFMTIEIPLLQRFVLFLGYPVYALTVVLFALLLFSGIGSLLTARVTAAPQRVAMRALGATVMLGAAYSVLVPVLVEALLGISITLKILATAALLAPIGLLLGTAYPLGIMVLREVGEELVPWAWALNGALSVVASVVAIFLGSRIGFTAAFLTGVASYGLALTIMGIVPRLRSLIAAPVRLTEPHQSSRPAVAVR
jgi:SAM-dependent methyltransferase